ncbi:uncharacterized protein LOC142974895 [Anticarsia gemmatalis]|uniref:uncharacterized protein LOC142974895 n=1 Tax=Anticarsia gemmatalis TaxID=129554 RepID=UPI003F7703C7
MGIMIRRFYIPFIFIILIIEATVSESNETSSSVRHGRGAGRIVKLYSGTRPEPIVCTGEGFQKDPHNCGVFYRCMQSGNGKYTVFRFQCGPGTVYDPETEVCNHPRSTKRSECGGYSAPIADASNFNEVENLPEIPSPIIVNKPVLATLSTPKTSTLTTARTPAPFYSTHTTKRDVTSAATSPYPWGSTITNVYIDNHFSAYPSNPTAATSRPFTTSPYGVFTPSTSNIPPSNSRDNICTSDGFMGDTRNCRKFYRCVANQSGGYIRYEFSCTETTVWDDDNQICNHAWAVKRGRCSRRGDDIDTLSSYENGHDTNPNTERNKPNLTVQQQLQISYGSKVSQTQVQISNGPVVQNQTQIHYGDRINNNNNRVSKQNQTQISHSSAVSQSQTQINSGNKAVQTQVQIDHSKDSSQSQVQISNTSTRRASTSTTPATNGGTNTQNSNQCKQEGFMGDSNDCQKFYRCVGNEQGGYQRFEFKCADGTAWDQSAQGCNHAWAVKGCGSQGSNQGTTHNVASSTTKTTQSYHTTTMGYHPVPDDKEDYDDNGYGQQNPAQASSSTTMSSSSPITTPTTKTTSAITTTTIKSTTVNNSKGKECTSSGFMADENDCKIFYRCVENSSGGYTKHEFKCGEGTVWDPKHETCNHAWAVEECGSKASGESTTHAVATSYTTTTQKSTQGYQTTTVGYHPGPDLNNNEDYEDNGYGQQKPPQEPVPSSTSTTTVTSTINDSKSGECKSSGFMADENDCKIFYRCVENSSGGYTKYEFKCGEGTVWDPKYETCNHAWAVEKCGKDASSTTDKVTTSSSVNTQTTKVSHPTTEMLPTQADDVDDDPGYGPPNNDRPITTTTKRPSTTTSYICPSSGFVGDEHDCRKFYRCEDNGNGGFTSHEFTCGPGTAWDPRINTCNHESEVPECHGMTPKPTTSTTQGVGGSSSTTESIKDVTTMQPQRPTTSATESAPSDSHKCTQSGFMGNPQNCKKFYRCVDNGDGSYTKYEFTCAEGSVWDQSIEACNHEWAVEGCGGTSETNGSSETTPQYKPPLDDDVDDGYGGVDSSSTPHTTHSTTKRPDQPTSSSTCKSSGFFGDENNCKKFYRCVDDGKGGFTRYEFDCGEGTVWDQSIEACNHAWAVEGCGNAGSSTTQITSESTTSMVVSQDPGYPSTTEDSSHLNNNDNQTSVTCSKEGFIGDPNNCRVFSRCVDDGKGGFVKYEFKCGEGTFWSQEILSCDHVTSDNECGQKGSTSTSEPVHDEIHTESTTTFKDENNMTTKPPTSSDVCTADGFYGDKNDCKKFYRCVDNGKGGYTKYDFTCGDGTAWDQEIQTCNHKSDQNCQTTSDQPQQGDSSTSSTTTTETSTEKHESSTDKQPTSESNESEVCSSEGFHGNKQDCTKFYRCVDDGKGGYTRYDFTCSEGTAWDSDIQSCNHIDQVPSCQRPIMNDENPQTTTQQSTAASESSSSSSSSSQSPQSSDTCESEGYFGNTQDCKKFYRCVDNGNGGYTKYDFDCAEGTIWDQDLTTCNHPGDVANPSCKDNQSGGTTESGTSGSSSQTTSGGSTQSSTESQQEGGSKEPANSDVNCTQAGYYPNPNDCKKFYRCVDWDGDGTKFSVFHFECGEGTIWDPAVETCNHEDSVYPPRNCSGSQSQAGGQTSTTESSTTTQETTDSTTQSTTESTTQSTTESTTQSTTESTTQSTTESTTQSTTESTTQSTTDSTTQSTTESTTESTTQSTTESTTQSTTESTTQSTTESTTQSTTESTTQSTTESTTQSTTDSTTQSTTESTTSETTEHSTTTDSTTTTEKTEESTTEKSEQSTTEKSDETTTESHKENVTEQPATTEPEPTTTEGSATEQSTTESETDSTTEESSGPQECPETAEGEYLYVCPSSFRRHPKYCNLFYQCDEDEETHEIKTAVFTCPNNTIYDETQTKCVEESKANKKCEGEISQKRRLKRGSMIQKYYPLEVSTDSYDCPREGYYTFEKGTECSPGFLKCLTDKYDELQGIVYQCPKGYVYWNVSRRCEPKDRVSDCKQSPINDWSNRWQIPIEIDNVAWL